MKKLLMMLLFVAPLSMMAQKIGHFDYEGILQVMPEYKTAQTELEAVVKMYEEEIAGMQKEFQNKMEKYQKEVTAQTPANIRERREKELVDMEQRLRQAYEDNNTALQKEQQNKMQPIIVKLSDAINMVAKEGNYVYLFDKTAATANRIFLNEALSEDVTPLVMKKLGISATTALPVKQ
jgi:outer membrane protein